MAENRATVVTSTAGSEMFDSFDVLVLMLVYIEKNKSLFPMSDKTKDLS